MEQAALAVMFHQLFCSGNCFSAIGSCLAQGGDDSDLERSHAGTVCGPIVAQEFYNVKPGRQGGALQFSGAWHLGSLPRRA